MENALVPKFIFNNNDLNAHDIAVLCTLYILRYNGNDKITMHDVLPYFSDINAVFKSLNNLNKMGLINTRSAKSKHEHFTNVISMSDFLIEDMSVENVYVVYTEDFLNSENYPIYKLLLTIFRNVDDYISIEEIGQNLSMDIAIVGRYLCGLQKKYEFEVKDNKFKLINKKQSTPVSFTEDIPKLTQDDFLFVIDEPTNDTDANNDCNLFADEENTETLKAKKKSTSPNENKTTVKSSKPKYQQQFLIPFQDMTEYKPLAVATIAWYAYCKMEYVNLSNDEIIENISQLLDKPIKKLSKILTQINEESKNNADVIAISKEVFEKACCGDFSPEEKKSKAHDCVMYYYYEKRLGLNVCTSRSV